MVRADSLILLWLLLVTECGAFSTSQPRHSQRNSLALDMIQTINARSSSANLEREIVSLGRTGKTDKALEVYDSLKNPSIRQLNGAIDACSRARPTRLEEAFQLLEDGIHKKNLRPNVFTFGSLVSACSRARESGRAIKVLRSMEVSKYCTCT